jgi:hypothetical protein
MKKRNTPKNKAKKNINNTAYWGIILKCILKEYDGTAWTLFKWLREGTSFCTMWVI